MASSLAKIDIHLIFHVKSTSVKFHDYDIDRVFAMIGGVIRGLGGLAIEIGGMSDHVHILTSLPSTMSLSDFVKSIKSNSSRWLKTIDSYYKYFSWQNGYGAFSVSPSLLEKTINYIKNQNEHHKKTTFKEEYKKFLEAYNIQYDERYVFSD